MSLVRIVEWTPAFDRRNPDPNKDYGIHGMNLRFVLKGEEAATQFLVYTNWLLKKNQERNDATPISVKYPHLLCHPLPADLGYHSLRPTYPEQPSTGESCMYLDGRRCFYDGSSLNAEELYWQFVERGDGAVWETLEDMYGDIVKRAAVLPLTVGPTGKSEEEVSP